MLIILLPGLEGTGHLFDAFVKCLPAGSQAKIVSYPTGTPLRYEQLEELVVPELPTSGKYIILAESFSGPIALALASRGGADLMAIVLVASFAYRALGRTGLLLARLPLSMICRLPIPNFVLRTFLLGRSASEDDLNRTRAAIGEVRPQVLACRVKEALTSDYGKRQRNRAARVVAIFAEYDHLLRVASRRSVMEVCPAAEVEVVAAPHLAFQVAPMAVLSVLQRLGILP